MLDSPTRWLTGAVIGASVACRLRASCVREAGMALVELSVVEQRYRAVLEAAAGVPVTEVAARYEVSRPSVHAWIVRYRLGGLGALADRPRRPDTCPHQVSAEIEAAVCELRREHPPVGPGAAGARAGQGRGVTGAVADECLPGAGPPWPGRARCPQAAHGHLPAMGAGGTDGAVANRHHGRGIPRRRHRGKDRGRPG